MSIRKLLLLAVGCGAVLFGVALWYSIAPRTRDVSDYPAVQPLLNQPLYTRRPATLFRGDTGNYALQQNVLVEYPTYAGQQLATLPVGTRLRFTRFVCYTNPVPGLTYLLGVGELTLPTGAVVPFEYSWDTVDPNAFTVQHAALPQRPAIWQPLPTQ